MDLRKLPSIPELELREVCCFTFTPDFVPSALLATLAAVERRLEASPAAPYAAHFLGVFKRARA